MAFSKWHVLNVVMLAGGGIYLALLGLSMLGGQFTWHPDFLGLHGEPLLVLSFAAWSFYLAVMSVRTL